MSDQQLIEKAKAELKNTHRILFDSLVSDDLIDKAVMKWIEADHGITIEEKAQILYDVGEEFKEEARQLLEYKQARTEALQC